MKELPNRFSEAIDASRKRIQNYRDKARMFIKDYCGVHYSEDGARDNVPFNMVYMFVEIMCSQLAANRPRVLVGTMHRAIRGWAIKHEAKINNELDRLGARRKLNRCTRDAMFGLGLMKMGLGASGKYFHDGDTMMPVGELFMEPIRLDDFVPDMTARDFAECLYMADEYLVSADEMKDRFKLTDGDLEKYPTAEDREGMDDRVDEMTLGSNPQYAETKYRLMDVYLPRSGVVLTVPRGMKEVLAETEYGGPECGPYIPLCLGEVSSNLLPLPPIANLFDMHSCINSISRKMLDQALREKSIGVYNKAAADDADVIRQTPDGGTAGVLSGEMKEVRYGGPNQVVMAFESYLMDKFSYLGGNLDSLGGLSPQSETASQDELLAANASRRLSAMRIQVMEFTRTICKTISHYVASDPLLDDTIPMQGPAGLTVPIRYRASDVGDIALLNIDVEPYSMQDATPAAKVQGMTNLLQNVLLPLMPMLQTQGAQIDAAYISETIARWTNVPEYGSMIRFNGVPPTEQTPMEMPKPSHTTRTYERINRPGATRAGHDQVFMQSLLGKGVQPSAASAALRPVG